MLRTCYQYLKSEVELYRTQILLMNKEIKYYMKMAYVFYDIYTNFVVVLKYIKSTNKDFGEINEIEGFTKKPENINDVKMSQFLV